MDTQTIIVKKKSNFHIDKKNNIKIDNKYKIFKRIIDFIVAIILIIILLPLILIISLLIKIDSKGPIIFKQLRAGINSEDFYIYKFRTMSIDSPNVPTNQIKIKGCKVTKIGKILRKTSLDEIPQLYNIIKGEMSFIGPRPVISSELKLITLRKKYDIDKIHPGITGWAQINGRDEISIYKKLELDYEYYQNSSLKFDIYIIFITIVKVLKAEGIKED